ncbi:MAG: endolytic transglycosylase MltG [Amphritea sp.]
MRKIVLSFLLTFLVLAIAAFSGWQALQSYLDSPLAVNEPEIILVEQGSSFRRVGNELAGKGLLERPDWLAFYIRMQKTGHLLKAGEYRLQPGVTPRQLVKQLVEGKSLAYNFTVVEGSTFAQLRTSLAQSEKLVLKTSTMTDAEIMLALGLEKQHPEGLFLADTYQFHRGMSDLDLLRRANKLLQEVLDQAWLEQAQQLPYEDAYEALIMASIVEKETALASERPSIAGVFIKRLEKGMRLQTDPTVIYGMGDAYKGNIRKSDLLRKTPYNTYKINGLPPTPIAMVGREAIHAALHPEGNKWLYFVAKGNGSHQFSATLRQHNRAVREYQQRRRADYRSTPSQ